MLKGDFITALIYDAAYAWAHAANKTLEEGIYPTATDTKQFGKRVAEHLYNLEFEGKFLALTYLCPKSITHVSP